MRIVPIWMALAWDCPDCRLTNFHKGMEVTDVDDDLRAEAAERGLTLDAYAQLPEIVWCRKCEAGFRPEPPEEI